MKKVSIVIPVYNQWPLVKRNIDALLKYDSNLIVEIIVVNDCSPEPNTYFFDPNVVRIISNEKNLGYTGTVNIGLKKAVSEIVILLDSDAYPIEAFIEKLIRIYSDDVTIGCIGFSTVDDEGNDTGNYQYEASVADFILGQLMEKKLSFLQYWRGSYKMPNSCAVSFRKKCLEELNFFDESIFPVLDADVDVCMRIHRSEWKLRFCSTIVVSHKGGNSYKINYRRVLLNHESRWKLLKKFNKIRFPSIAKNLLKSRVFVELIIFKLLQITKPVYDYTDKIKGRKILLEEIDSYV